MSGSEHVQEYRRLAYPTAVWAGVDTETKEVARDSKQGNTDQRIIIVSNKSPSRPAPLSVASAAPSCQPVGGSSTTRQRENVSWRL